MPKIYEKPLIRGCYRFYKEDIEMLEKLAIDGIKVNMLLREIIHNYVIQAGAKLREKVDQLEKSGRETDGGTEP